MCQTKKYYRMSQKKLELGKPVQGTGALHLGAELEKLLEQQRPDECISRTDCVFFSDNEDPKKHGLPYDYGYLHVIEPVGPVQKRDNYWLGQLQTRHHPTLSWRQDLSIADLTDKKLADKYWKGEPSNKPNWEMVARSATVMEYASEEPVQVRKPLMADALKTVAEYENSKNTEK
jgi:hypothetical protein